MATATVPTRELIYERPWLYPKQRDAIFDPALVAVIEASTKSGKTAGCLVWLTEQAMRGQSGQQAWWVAPSYGQTKDVFLRLIGDGGRTRGLPTEIVKPNQTELTATLANGVRMMFKTGEKPDLLYGSDVLAAVMDEASRSREEAWWAIQSTLTATQGPVRIIGNVRGRKNWFYALARRAEAGEPGMHFARITWRDAVAAVKPDGEPVIAEAAVEKARRDMPARIFAELFETIPADEGDQNPFGLGAIAACVAPLSSSAPVAWGWDLAKSVDWTVGIGLDAEGHACRLERWQRSWEDTIRMIPAITQGTLALVDSTGVGDPVLEALQRSGVGGFVGYQFTGPSKQQLMEGLALAIQRQAVTFPAGPIQSELESFEYEYTRLGVRYAAAEGMHDDCVCALALAVHQFGRTVGTAPTIRTLGAPARAESQRVRLTL